MNIGEQNTFLVEKFEPQGAYLIDVLGDRVLLPNAYVTEDLKVDDEITVYVYNDSEDRPVATTLTPYIQLNEIVPLVIKGTSKFGAFADWGLPKDLFIPFGQQHERLITGNTYLVYLYRDEKTNRLVGSTKIDSICKNTNMDITEGSEVDILVFSRNDLGYKVVINKKHMGLAYENEIFQEIRIGDQLKGFIKQIRSDNKVDVLLQKSGYSQVDDNSDKILNYLKEHRGFVALNDKSSPEMIKSIFSMSKKSFKMAIGKLYKERTIQFDSDGIRLIEK